METPTPDTKNWTWVLDRPCPECGYDGPNVARDSIAAAARANAAAWRAVLKRGDVVTERPPTAPGELRWSALEYAAHTRDVYALAVERVTQIIKKKRPTFQDWNQDQAAIDGDYANEDPAKVGYALAANAGKFADLIDRVRDGQWEREGARSDGAEFSLASLATYLLHDVTHHLHDAQSGIDAIVEARKKAKKQP